jgi:hypothetical protein
MAVMGQVCTGINLYLLHYESDVRCTLFSCDLPSKTIVSNILKGVTIGPVLIPTSTCPPRRIPHSPLDVGPTSAHKSYLFIYIARFAFCVPEIVCPPHLPPPL